MPTQKSSPSPKEELPKPFLTVVQPFKASVMEHLNNLIKDYSKEQGWDYKDVKLKSDGDLLHLIHIPKS